VHYLENGVSARARRWMALCSAYVLREVLHCAGRRALTPACVGGRMRPKRERWDHAFPIPTVSAKTVTEEVAFGSVLECFCVGETATEYPIRCCVAQLFDVRHRLTEI